MGTALFFFSNESYVQLYRSVVAHAFKLLRGETVRVFEIDNNVYLIFTLINDILVLFNFFFLLNLIDYTTQGIDTKLFRFK